MVLLRVDTIWTGSGVTGGGITQMFFQNLTTDAQACVSAVQSFWAPLTAFITPTATRVVATTVPVFQEADGALLGVEAVVPAASVQGTAGEDPLPLASQGLIRWITPEVVNNRLLRGRTFIPSPSETHNGSNGAPLANYLTAAGSSVTALLDDAVANFVIWHRPVGGSGGLAGIVGSGTPWTKWAVLRSRRD